MILLRVFLLSSIVSLLAACFWNSASELSPNAFFESLNCDDKQNIKVCKPLGFKHRSTLVLRPPVRQPSKGNAPGVVILDAGGPGIDIAQAFKSGHPRFPSVWDTSTIAIVQEPWQQAALSPDCRAAINVFFTSLRSPDPTDSGRGLVQACKLSQLGWSEQEYAQTVQAVIDRAGTPPLLVGSSFGAYRMRAILDDITPDDPLGTLVLFDSPPDAIFGTGKDFLKRRAANLDRVLHASFLEYCEKNSCGAIAFESQLHTLYATDFISDNDVSAGLIAAMMKPLQNSPWLWSSISQVKEKQFQRQYKMLVDAALKHKSFDVYAESWAGYFAELCPRLRDWPASAEQHSGRVPKVWDFLVKSHRLCRFVEYSPWKFADSGHWTSCAVRRPLDIVSTHSKTETAFGAAKLLNGSGHIPLLAAPDMNLSINELMARKCDDR